MKLKEITHRNEFTFQDSIAPDLIESKIWLAQTLKKFGLDDFNTIYVLGSWYGNMCYILDRCKINCNKIINIDLNQTYLDVSSKVMKNLNLDTEVIHLNLDVNEINYKMLGKNGLIINTSINDILKDDWFENIPSNTLVALQTRNRDKDLGANLKKFDQTYKLSKTLFLSQITTENTEGKYQRYMKIGFK